MTIHYHGLPITPTDPAMLALSGKHFCVSYADPRQVKRAHEIGQSVMLDNGAFTAFTQKRVMDWSKVYAWMDPWLDYATTWAVIPDEIDAGSQAQDALLRDWPFGKRKGAPVWHTSEPLDRLLRLVDDGWDKVCFGSTDEHWHVMGKEWRLRMDETFTLLANTYKRTPWIHMLRGMNAVKSVYPFASVDSTDVGRNHNRKKNPLEMAERWDAMQCPPGWLWRLDALGERI